jgi:hypothetical protein
MGKIENHNFLGICCEESCGVEYTHCLKKTINGVKVLIPLCKQHYWELL